MLNSIAKTLKEFFEFILFLFLILTMPVWILPYTLVIKHREKKKRK